MKTHYFSNQEIYYKRLPNFYNVLLRQRKILNHLKYSKEYHHLRFYHSEVPWWSFRDFPETKFD